ncbi:MAG: tolC 1 [Firmicutes bacterium]|nr:tolC 1 [Bacillota bacterium]
MKLKRFFTGVILGAAFFVSLGSLALATPIELSLDDCISSAVKNNSTVKTAEEDKEKNRWAINEAKGNKGLSLNYTNTDYRKETASSSGNANSSSPYNLYNHQIVLSLPLYSGGKLENLVDQSQLNYKVSELTVAATKQQIKFNATSAYYQVLQYNNLVKADQASVDDYTLHLANLQHEYEAGLASKLDVLQTQVSLANAQQSLTKDQTTYRIALMNLNNIMGLLPNTEVVLKEELKYEKTPLSLEECLNYALKNRPEIEINKNNVAIAKADVKIAESGKLPTLTLSGYDAWQSQQWPGTKYHYFSEYLTVSFNIFDSGVVKAKENQAAAALRKAQENNRQISNTIYVNVSQYYLNMKEAEKRIETSSVSVSEAQEALGISKVRFQSGLGTNQDVLDAEVALTTAKNNYVQALYDYNVDKAGLEEAMGIEVK